MHSHQTIIAWADILTIGTVPFSLLEDAFGPESLGIIVVKDLPARFADLRRRLLSYSSYLANLPAEKLGTHGSFLAGAESRGCGLIPESVYSCGYFWCSRA